MIIPAFRPRDKVTIAYVGGTSSNANTATHTFTNHAIGAAAPDRVVLVAAAAQGISAFTFGTITIGGVAATPIATALFSASRALGIRIAGLLVPAGTQATIVVPLVGTSERCRLAVSSMRGANVRDSLAAFSTATKNTGGNALTATLDIPSNGAAIGCANFLDSTAGLTGATWAGLTEAEDQNVEINNTLITSAASSNMAAETGRTISATSNLDSDLGSVMALASFKCS